MKMKVNELWTRPGEHEETGQPLSTVEFTLPEGGRFAYRIGQDEPVRIALPPGVEIRVEVLEGEAPASQGAAPRGQFSERRGGLEVRGTPGFRERVFGDLAERELPMSRNDRRFMDFVFSGVQADEK